MLFYILRGVPGCGKSTVAKNLAGEHGAVCEADNYFISDYDGVYRFDAKKLGLAHGWCRDITRNAMEAKRPVIVLSNTNTNPNDFASYEEMAKEFGYTVFHLIVENRHGGTDSHNVPEISLIRMESMLRANIKLR
jgi:predicted kinase